MEILSKEAFAELANYQSDPCVSIFMPTHRTSEVVQNEKQDPIILKTQLQEAEKQLREQGMGKGEAAEFLQPGYDLLQHELFWNNQLEGLAIFIAKGFFKTLTLPLPIKEELVINSSFYISPLMPALTNDEQFYVLVFSKHISRFYLGNAYGMQELNTVVLPQGIDDVINFQEKEGNQLFREGGPAPEPVPTDTYPHNSSHYANEKDYMANYLRAIDQGLWKQVLANDNKPLLLAAVESEVGAYRHISHYKHLSEEAIFGNYEREDKMALWEKAREKLAPYFKAAHQAALENYYNHIATPLTSSMPETVIPASYYSRVADLFVQKDAPQIWGTFNEADNVLVIHEQQQDGDESLLDKAVSKTVLNGGTVHVLEAEQMPKESIVAAFMRY